MKIPEQAPELSRKIMNDFAGLIELSENEEMKSLLAKANRNYMYWDKFKFQKIPKGVSPETAWFFLKLSRKTHAEFIPARDKNNQLFSFWLPNQIQEKIYAVDNFGKGQIHLWDPRFNLEFLQQHFIRQLMEEAISSSLLEGAATTRQKAKELLMSGRKPTSHAEKMVANMYQTMRRLGEFKDQPLSQKLIHEIHRGITQDTIAQPNASGRYRTEKDDVLVKEPEGKPVFLPPPAGEIHERMMELINFANKAESSGEFIHPVVKAIILHFWVACIHPYADGNGRTARALFYWYLLKKNYRLMESISISQMILKAPAQYIKAFLHSEMDDRDLTYFISYHLEIISQAIQELRHYLGQKQDAIRGISSTLDNHPHLNLRQLCILYHALTHPGKLYSIQNHKVEANITYETARTDLMKLTEMNLMEKVKKDKAFYYLIHPDLETELKANRD